SAQQEYFVASDATDLHVLLPLFSCLKDTLVVLREFRPVPLFRELVPDNILYTGKISNAEKAYYLGGARALICGAAHELDHLPLAALRCGIPVLAHPSQGMAELLADPIFGAEVDTGSADALIGHIRRYRQKVPERTKIAREMEWLSRDYFLRRWKKILTKGQ
ncbi:MAG: glycosyltransferase, partial [Leptospiraceae bacterium]|nr:glycosyltransferase [Leptospiraceae bacterium]